MSTFTVCSEEFQPSLETRTLRLSNGTEIRIPMRARIVQFGLSDDQVVSLTIFNGSLASPLAVYDNLNLKPLCVECITAYLNLKPEHKVYNHAPHPGQQYASPAQR